MSRRRGRQARHTKRWRIEGSVALRSAFFEDFSQFQFFVRLEMSIRE